MTLPEITTRLTASRKARKMTRHKLRTVTGLHAETINAIEAGASGFTASALFAYADAVGMYFALKVKKSSKTFGNPQTLAR